MSIKQNHFLQLAAFLILLIRAPVYAESFSAEDVEILGLERTQPFVVLTELKLLTSTESPSAFSTDSIEQQLLATGLFSKVNSEWNNEKLKSVTVEEKWTTIPIFKLNSGGGTRQSIFGVYDPNILGRRIEIGAQYELLENVPSTVFWNKIPRLFETKFFTDLQVWNTKRIRLKYDPTSMEPIVMKGFLLQSNRYYAAVGYEFRSDLKARLSVEHQTDQFSEDLVPTEILNQVQPQDVPEKTKILLYGLSTDWGAYKIVDHVQVGSLVVAQIKWGQVLEGSMENFYQVKLDATYTVDVTKNLLWAQRLQLGHTDSTFLQFKNYLGGFDSIRGFVDNRFAAESYWLVNSEVRHKLYTNSKLILQGVAFTDALGIKESPRKIENAVAASAGVGARVIAPKIYRLVLRLDYAVPFINKDESKISFGLQQYF